MLPLDLSNKTGKKKIVFKKIFPHQIFQIFQLFYLKKTFNAHSRVTKGYFPLFRPRKAWLHFSHFFFVFCTSFGKYRKNTFCTFFVFYIFFKKGDFPVLLLRSLEKQPGPQIGFAFSSIFFLLFYFFFVFLDLQAKMIMA